MTLRTGTAPGPAEAALAWFTDTLRRAAAGEKPSTAQQGEYFEPDAYMGLPGPNSPPEFWEKLAARAGADFEVIDTDCPTDLQARATLVRDADKAWQLSITVSPEPPHRIIHCATNPTVPGLVVRLATEADAAALAEVERNAPIVLGDRKITIDRGDDYFAAARLMSRVAVAIGEIYGRPVGVFCGALLPARIGGLGTTRFIAHHLRVIPEAQSTSLWRAISMPVFAELYGDADGGITYISPDNEASQRTHNPAEKWTITPIRAVLDTAVHRGAPAGRKATREDVPRIVELLNAAHGNEEGFVPYTASSFLDRVSRAGHYSLDNVWCTADAVMGVWPAGESIEITIETNGHVTTHRRGLVLDYGFYPNNEHALLSLIGAWCSWLHRRGHDQLAIFTSPASPGYNAIRDHDVDLEQFDLWAGNEPEGASHRGWYVDAAYF